MAKALLTTDERELVDRATQDILQLYGVSPPDVQSASVDPSYDSRKILELMLDRKKPPGWVDMYDLQEQYRIDNPNDPQEPEPYRPLPRRER
jgi:hypothetical protein